MARLALAIVLLGCCTCTVWSINDRLREVFSWRQVDFAFPDQQTREAAIASGEYVQANNMPLGLEVWRDKLFITVPRWKTGVASTLNYVSIGSDSKQNRTPLLVPYPNYEINQLPKDGKQDGNRIISTFRMSVDECDRLWVIDMGLANGISYSQPQIFIIDLKTDNVIRQFTLTENLRRRDNTTWFVGVLADVDPMACNKAFAYLPDIRGGLVVYSFEDNTAWRLDHPYFFFDPLATVFRAGGVRVEFRDGIFGLALSERHSDGYRTLYFQPMSSTRMFSVNTRVVQSNSSLDDVFDKYQTLGHRKIGMQASVMSRDTDTGAVFYPLVNQDAVGCWNPWRSENHSVGTSAVVAQDSEMFEYPSDLKVDVNSNLWVISDKLLKFVYHVEKMNFNEVNFRVLMAPVAGLIKGTVCEPLKSTGTSYSTSGSNKRLGSGTNIKYNMGSNTGFNNKYSGYQSGGFNQNNNSSHLMMRPRPSK